MSTVDTQTELQNKIKKLAKEKNAVILAHYYQRPEIQEIADFIGDSLQLAQKAKETTDKDLIVFCGVKFMAETAKIVNPQKKVILPDLEAGCSLADNCPPDKFAEFCAQYPDHFIMTYVNTSAEIKAMSDIVCTSSNAEFLVSKLPKDQKIIFAPDQNLGKYIMKKSGRDMVLWRGSCVVHEAFSFEKLVRLFNQHPDAQIIAHPESEPHILDTANFVGSTAKMINYVQTNPAKTFIVATEAGILQEMQRLAPDKHLIPAPAEEDNTCACSECAFMKMNTLEKLYRCLVNEDPVIELDQEVIEKAMIPLERMFEWMN